MRATDSKGNFVRDLTKEDFQIFEDGQPQTIAAFSLIDIPIEPSRPSGSGAIPIEPDVRSNERRFDGRVYVMMLDDAGTPLIGGLAPKLPRAGSSRIISARTI